MTFPGVAATFPGVAVTFRGVAATFPGSFKRLFEMSKRKRQKVLKVLNQSFTLNFFHNFKKT